MRGLCIFFLSLLLSFPSSKAFAHRVNIFAYVEGGKILTESYYSDGTPVKEALVEVFDKRSGEKLLEGKTNEQGEFPFKVPAKSDLRIVLNASMGHRAEAIIPERDLPEVLPRGEMSSQEKALQVDTEEIKKVVEEAVEEKLRPLIQMIAQTQASKMSPTEVIGGIGYILGLMGLVMYFRSRRKNG